MDLTQVNFSLIAAKAPTDMDLDPDTWDNKTITSGLKNYLRFINTPKISITLNNTSRHITKRI